MIRTIKMEQMDTYKVLSLELSKDSFLTEELILNLYQVFKMTSISHLKRSISDIFFAYIIDTSPENFKNNFQEMATDIYFLLKFLDMINGKIL